jgi:hypothetical protein
MELRGIPGDARINRARRGKGREASRGVEGYATRVAQGTLAVLAEHGPDGEVHSGATAGYEGEGQVEGLSCPQVS